MFELFNTADYQQQVSNVLNKIRQQQLGANFIVKKENYCNCGQEHIRTFYLDTEQEVNNFIAEAYVSGERIVSVYRRVL